MSEPVTNRSETAESVAPLPALSRLTPEKVVRWRSSGDHLEFLDIPRRLRGAVALAEIQSRASSRQRELGQWSKSDDDDRQRDARGAEKRLAELEQCVVSGAAFAGFLGGFLRRTLREKVKEFVENDGQIDESEYRVLRSSASEGEISEEELLEFIRQWIPDFESPLEPKTTSRTRALDRSAAEAAVDDAEAPRAGALRVGARSINSLSGLFKAYDDSRDALDALYRSGALDAWIRARQWELHPAVERARLLTRPYDLQAMLVCLGMRTLDADGYRFATIARLRALPANHLSALQRLIDGGVLSIWREVHCAEVPDVFAAGCAAEDVLVAAGARGPSLVIHPSALDMGVLTADGDAIASIEFSAVGPRGGLFLDLSVDALRVCLQRGKQLHWWSMPPLRLGPVRAADPTRWVVEVRVSNAQSNQVGAALVGATIIVKTSGGDVHRVPVRWRQRDEPAARPRSDRSVDSRIRPDRGVEAPAASESESAGIGFGCLMVMVVFAVITMLVKLVS